MPDEYVSVETDGLEVSSNSESQEEMQEILGVKAKEAPSEKPLEKPAEKPAAKPEEKAEATDRDEKGRFKAKPIPDKKPEGEAKAEKPSAESKSEETESGEEGKDKKSRPGRLDARQRVEQATRVAAEERRQREAAVRENQALRQALEVRKEAKPKDKPKNEDAPPELTEGKDPIEFVQETSEWAARKAQREADQKRQKEEYLSRFQQEAARREKKFAETMEQHGKKNPDFAERIDPRLLMLKPTWNLEEGERPSVWSAIADEVADSSLAPELLIHLSEHEEELQRLATLGPRALTRAMAKLEAKLEAATAGTTAPEVPPYKPSAAEPVTPVTGAATTAEGPPDPDTCSFEDYKAYWDKQERTRRRA